MAYFIDDVVGQRQAYYDCPVHSCRTGYTNLMLVVQHIMSKHISVQDGIALHSEASNEILCAEQAGQNDQAPGRTKKTFTLSQCEICNKVLMNKQILKRHMLTMHKIPQEPVEKKTAKCQYCSKVFSHERNLVRHVKTAHAQGKDEIQKQAQDPPIVIIDDLPDETLDDEQAFDDEESVVMEEENIEPEEDLEPEDDLELQVDNKEDSASSFKKAKKLECDFCHKTYTYERALRNHVASKHEHESSVMDSAPLDQEDSISSQAASEPEGDDDEELFKCRICPKTFRRKNIHKRHEVEIHNLDSRNSTEPERFSCAFCKEPFKRFPELTEHVKATHRDKFQCFRCKKISASPRCLILHQTKCLA